MDEREYKKLSRFMYVLDKIATELDQSPTDTDEVTYWTQDPAEYLLGRVNELIPNPREEIKILEVFESDDVLRIKSNHSEYE